MPFRRRVGARERLVGPSVGKQKARFQEKRLQVRLILLENAGQPAVRLVVTAALIVDCRQSNVRHGRRARVARHGLQDGPSVGLATESHVELRQRER